MGSPTKVREQLEEQRRGGRDFAVAWTAALAALSPDDRNEWLSVLRETESAWRDAYGRRPASRAQLALSAVDQDPERDVATGDPDPWERICANCGGPISATKRLSARYCSPVCQRAVHGRQIAASGAA